MIKYSLSRLLESLVTVFLIVTLVFLLMRLMPAEYFFTEDEFDKLTDEQIEERIVRAGLRDPIPTQLFRFYGQLLQGDLGKSSRIQNGVPVMDLVGQRVPISMRMGLIAIAIALLIGVVMGTLQALFKDTIVDYLFTAYTIFVNAVPHLVSYSLILIAGNKLFGVPSTYSTKNPVATGILPIVCLALGSIASYALWTRRYMVDEFTKDYLKLARVKGMSSRDIAFKHVLKNAFVPLAHQIPASILLTISGSMLAERFFSVPGMGGLLTDSVAKYDVNMTQGLVMIYSALGILGVFLGDLLMMFLDPRIKLTGKGDTR